MREAQIIYEGDSLQIFGLLSYDFKTDQASFQSIFGLYGENLSLEDMKLDHLNSWLANNILATGCAIFASIYIYFSYHFISHAYKSMQERRQREALER
jgi:hypothetical protein